MGRIRHVQTSDHPSRCVINRGRSGAAALPPQRCKHIPGRRSSNTGNPRRSSNAQPRTYFKRKRAQCQLGLCRLRCFFFRHPRVGTLRPQAGALLRKFRLSAHRPQAKAPLTRTTRRSQHFQCLATQLFVALLPKILLQARCCAQSLTAEHAAALSSSALELPLNRATHRHKLLL